MIDRKNFFTYLRDSKMFGPRLDQSEVDGLLALLEACECWPVSWTAYALATAYHETAHTMLPIKEYGSNAYLSKYDTGRLAAALGNTPQADGDGQLYAGRGYVQLTGRANYAKAERLLGLPLLKNPDLAMKPDVAAKILRSGMESGWFTGKSLKTYLPAEIGTYEQFKQARRIINGTDKWDKIAGHAAHFQKALLS